jgi:radical SAM-linked protein
MERIRIFYSKTEAMRYTGNLDVHKVWERTLRRARLPLTYSQGFHPQPRINQACPLPLGILSKAEAIDIWLDETLPEDQILDCLSKALPSGLEVSEIRKVEQSQPALPTLVKSSEFVVTLLEDIPIETLKAKLAAILEAPAIMRERRGKNYDLRPLIEALELLPPAENDRQRLFLRLSAREGATGRPDEVLLAMGIEMTNARVERTALVMAF